MKKVSEHLQQLSKTREQLLHEKLNNTESEHPLICVILEAEKRKGHEH